MREWNREYPERVRHQSIAYRVLDGQLDVPDWERGPDDDAPAGCERRQLAPSRLSIRERHQQVRKVLGNLR